MKSIVLLLMCSLLMPVLAWAEPQRPGNEEIRTTANRIAERFSDEFAASWNEFRTSTDMGGSDDGSRLTGYLTGACSIDDGPFWRETSLWLTNHVDTRRGPREASQMSRSFRRKLVSAIKTFDTGDEVHVALNTDETMREKPGSLEHDLRQRAELLMLMRSVIGGLASAHEAEPRELGSGYAFVMWRRLQCEFADQSTAALEQYIEDNGYPGEGATDTQTELASIILFANISGYETRQTILDQAQADKLTRGISEDAILMLEQSLAESLVGQ